MVVDNAFCQVQTIIVKKVETIARYGKLLSYENYENKNHIKCGLKYEKLFPAESIVNLSLVESSILNRILD